MDLNLPVDLNMVVLTGTLAVTPEMNRFDSGSRRIDYLVTVRTLKGGRMRSDTISVKYWDPPARMVRKKLERGDRICVAGMVQRRFWSAYDGKRSRVEVVASQVVYRPEDLSLVEFDPDQNVIQFGDLAATTT